MTDKMKVDILIQISEGLKKLNELEVVHGDLKPSNILMNEQRRALIADYGTSRILREDSTIESQTLETTVKYAPPELLIDQRFTFQVIFEDFWGYLFDIRKN